MLEGRYRYRRQRQEDTGFGDDIAVADLPAVVPAPLKAASDRAQPARASKSVNQSHGLSVCVLLGLCVIVLP